MLIAGLWQVELEAYVRQFMQDFGMMKLRLHVFTPIFKLDKDIFNN